MVNVISFQQALSATQNVKRHLLLGNGFSIALFPDRFRYGSLLEETDFSAAPQLEQAFRKLQTTDFEVVIQALRQTTLLLPLYSDDEDIVAAMVAHAEMLKELLVQAIAGRHPERPADIEEEQYQACRNFLAHFIGDERTKPHQTKDLRGNLYTVSYDLLLYWTLMHTSNAWDIDEGGGLQHDDGFRSPDDPDAEYVTWDGEEARSQRIYYLHGALHLYDYGYELQKICWERSGGRALIDQARAALDSGRFPLFVSEGNSKGKMERIRHSGYLHKALRSFRGNCDVKAATLFIFGHSLADNDAHIMKQIEKGRAENIYISLHGGANEPHNRDIIERANLIKSGRSRSRPLEVHFFDAASANVWNI